MKIFTRFGLVLGLVAVSTLGVPAQTPSTGRLMREKLTHSQKILEAIMTSDLALLERESAQLEGVTRSPAWSVLQSPEYVRQSNAFLRAAQDLVDAAKGHDLDAAATHYMALTQSCFQCHRYMKNRRLANQ